MSGVAFLVLGVVFTLSWALSLVFAVAVGIRMERLRLSIEKTEMDTWLNANRALLAKTPLEKLGYPK